MKTDSEQEIIGDYKVHPAASLFPLIEGEDFEDLVFSVKTLGVLQPIVVSKGMLIDGRNRLRAVTRLRKEGCTLALPTKELDLSVESVSEYIFGCNVHRRNLTPAQIAAITTNVWPMITKEKEAKQKSTQFKLGNKANPVGKNKRTANTDSCSPSPRDAKQMHEQSTVGQIAKLAKVSHHTASQMVAVNKAVEAGELPKDTKAKIIAGTLKLKDIAPKPKARPKAKEADDEPDKKKKDAAFEDIKRAIDCYLEIDFTNKKRLREIIGTYLDNKGN